MDDHDAQRIAAAMHAARPDWPASSVLTLIRKKLIDRPRRDVFVALAWVASEPNSATPARVLEQGPWWKAVGGEGSINGRREWPDDRDRCADCSLPQARCRQLWSGNHDFLPVTAARQAANAIDVPRAVQGLRDVKATEEPPERPEPETSTEGSTHVAQLRAELTKETA